MNVQLLVNECLVRLIKDLGKQVVFRMSPMEGLMLLW